MSGARSKQRRDVEGLRQRTKDRDPGFTSPAQNARLQRQKGPQPLPSPSFHLIVTILLFTLVSAIVICVEKQLPTPLMVDDIAENPGRFIAERSFKFLEKLTALGPRPTGSHANEILAVQLLTNEINSIAGHAKPAHKVLLDVQKSSGAFNLGFLDGMTSVYRNVQNVVVRLSSQEESPHSLLINCHFDTVPDSPGGSDDGASCAIMLEILRVITQRDAPVRHNVILLFNGAEESFMQASHGFITQHKWASEVRAFVNLEACGAGGREVLFQAGPEHPWLMQKYADSVPYPYASSLAEEVFQSGVIPGDTDFRIFRDYGNIPGLDFAWSTNGYVYHTEFDDVDQIPLGTLQRTGENILAVTLAIVNGHELGEVDKHAAGSLVFFDLLGAVVLRWSRVLNGVINIAVMALSVYTVYVNMQEAVDNGVPRRLYAKHLGWTCVVSLCAGLLAIATCLGIALTLTVLGRSMSWFARPVWVVFLYVCPTLLVPMVFIKFTSTWRNVKSPWILFQMHCDANQLLWTMLLGITTVFGIRSGFVAFLWVFFYCINTILRTSLFKKWKDWRWMVLHSVVLLPPFTQCFYLILGALHLILPVMGRIGAGYNGEVVLAVLLSAMCSLLLQGVVPMILLVKTPRRVFSFLGGLFLAALALLILTPLGFPYSGDPESRAPQRFMMAHAERTYHDLTGNVINHETGFWILNWDHNSPHSVQSVVPELKNLQEVESCATQLYCGMPYLIPILTMVWKTHWVPAPPPVLAIPTTLQLDSQDRYPGNVIRLSFTVTGPDHMSLIMSPLPGVEIVAWSHLEGVPFPTAATFQDRPIYFVYYSCASDPVPWTFWIDLKGAGPAGTHRIDIAASGHFMHGPNKQSPIFKQFVAQFPRWTTVSAWEATYYSWQF